MADAKSKRDLIWEQKKKMREQQARGQNAGQDAPDNAQPVNFAKKSLFTDNSAPEPILQNTRPPENQDYNRGRNFSQQPEEPVNQRNENPSPFQDRREPPFKMQDTAATNQPAYSEYEPPVNRNNNRQHARMADELQDARKPVNFNPSFEPTGGDYQANEQAVRDSRDLNDARRRKADYGEDLRNQMRQKEMAKQQEKNEVRNSVQGISGNDNFYRENDRKQKGDYGDYLKQQMREKQEAKNQESGRVRNPEPQQQQEYFPFGKPGAGAPNREAFNNPPPMNYPPQNQQYPPPRQQQQQQQQQQQYYPPQGPGNFQQYPNQAPGSREFSRQQQQQQQQGGYPQQQQQQAYDYNRQQSDNYQPQRQQQQQQQPQQPYYNAPPSGQDGASMPRQEFARQERYGSYDQLPREEPEPPMNLNNEANNYRRGNTMERERPGYRGQPLSSEDPQMLARKEKMKQDFQKGLQEQIEFKKRQKEMEQKKKREEDRLEEDRLKREQEELAQRKALEDNKKKPQAQNAPPQEPNQFVQEPKNRRNREKPPVQAYEAQNNFDQNGPPPRGDPYGGYPGQPPYNQQQQQQQPPYNPQYQQQQHPYNPQYNPQYGQPQGYPPGPGPQQQFYPPGQMYPQMMRNEVTSELQNIRSEIQNQQNVLSKQLDSIKKEAMNAMEERNRAEKELTNLREQLKQKIISEDLYKKNLREALERNAQPRIQQNPEGPTRITYKEPPVGYDPYPLQEKPPRHRPPPSNSNSYGGYPGYPDTDNFEKQAYNIRQTNQNLLDNYQNMQMQESRTPFLDNDRTLAGDTKLIPLAVFDNRGSLEGTNVRRGGNDPLTMSKIQNYGMGRPSSSKQQPQWHKEDDSIDALLKAHGALRPGSSESNAFGDTSRMIGRHLDDASAIMRQGDISGTGKIVNRYNLKSREGTDTLSLAARNILADKSSNIGANPYGQPERRAMSRGEEGIKFNNTADILPDLSIGGHGGTHNYELAEGPSMNTTGMSFNIDRINMANEARLNKLDKFGSGHSRTDMHYDPGRGKGGNYYGNNRGELEAIEESADMDENLAKIDKILGSYLKTHEEEGIHKRDLMM